MYNAQTQRHFSNGSIIVRPKNLKNVEIGITTTARGKFEVKAYSGRSRKPDMYYLFGSMEARDQAIVRYLKGLEANATFKAERAAKRKLNVNPVQVGDIFVSSWGWEQTNVDFYEVVEVKNLSVSIRPIGSKFAEGGKSSGMSSNVVAIPGAFDGTAVTKRVQTWDNGKSISIKVGNNYAYQWDGTPQYSSWYA